MKRKKIFYSEFAYVLGIVILAFGVALMERADFGMSMIVAPAYLLHLKLSQYFPFFSFGVAEYVLQAILLVVLTVVMGHFKKGYLFSFVTAVLYGYCLDLAIYLVGLLPLSGVLWAVVCYLLGMALCALGVALFFHTYISPEAYELFVKELAEKFHKPIPKVKTVYDCISCLVGILLSFCFFGFGTFEGVKLGTILCALVNGWLIGWIGKQLDAAFTFQDALPLRRFFK